MKSLYLRIWLTVVAALALFALVSGWLVQRHLDERRAQADVVVQERGEAWGQLLQRVLPPATAGVDEQELALAEWALRLRAPLAMDDAQGRRIATSVPFARRVAERPWLAERALVVRLDDGRSVLVLRPMGPRRGAGPDDGAPRQGPPLAPPWPGPLAGLPEGLGFAALLLVLLAAVAAGAWPVVRRLTRRLEALQQGVEAFGAGDLHRRVAEDGRDEVAAVGASFNRAAARIEALLRSHQSLLANASHELRSPLARLRMALTLLDDAPEPQRAALKREIDANIAELDALVEEVLLASRLDAAPALERREPVALLALAAEEAARVHAVAQGEEVMVRADERLLRRALRNLLENARRYGGDEVSLTVSRLPDGRAEVQVCDRGPGVPEAYRERIFEPFFRLPGHAERTGGVGLGLALVRQIADRHDAEVRCVPREGGGSCFRLTLPAA